MFLFLDCVSLQRAIYGAGRAAANQTGVKSPVFAGFCRLKFFPWPAEYLRLFLTRVKVMIRAVLVVIGLLFSLSACDVGGAPAATNFDKSKVTYRMLDSVNELRAAAGAPPVQLNAQLTAAAATHSRDMSIQNRPWHFGSDGSSPLDRVVRTGYFGQMLGENISETFETELETLAAWMEQKDTRDVILDRRARNMGFAWYREENGKMWWTLLMGS